MLHIKSDGWILHFGFSSRYAESYPKFAKRMIVAIFISLICHIFCFNNIELSFHKKFTGGDSESSKIFFLGPILKAGYSHPSGKTGYSRNRIYTEILPDALKAKSQSIYELDSDFAKPPLGNLNDTKISYFVSFTIPKTTKANSGIMFYPPMPYHFLLYFNNRQTAHMEVAFYISPEGKVVGIKRKISSGNPEVDLLIMRNLSHFLNLCKSNFALDSWQIVNIDLSP